jgi:hypothetical protein
MLAHGLSTTLNGRGSAASVPTMMDQLDAGSFSKSSWSKNSALGRDGAPDEGEK